MAHTAQPTVVEVKRDEREVRVVWDDEHRSVFPMRYLRGFCPCAHCQGHDVGAWTFVAVNDPVVTKIEPVGSYALSIGFSDAHTTGIYSYEILRELCPCDECVKGQGDLHPVRRMQ